MERKPYYYMLIIYFKIWIKRIEKMLEMPLMKSTGWRPLNDASFNSFDSCKSLLFVNLLWNQLRVITITSSTISPPCLCAQKFLIRTTILNCLSTSSELHQKHIKCWKKKSTRRSKRNIETRSIISNSFISRFYIALSPSTCPLFFNLFSH